VNEQKIFPDAKVLKPRETPGEITAVTAKRDGEDAPKGKKPQTKEKQKKVGGWEGGLTERACTAELSGGERDSQLNMVARVKAKGSQGKPMGGRRGSDTLGRVD